MKDTQLFQLDRLKHPSLALVKAPDALIINIEQIGHKARLESLYSTHTTNYSTQIPLHDSKSKEQNAYECRFKTL